MPNHDQSLIPWMCFRPVSMDLKMSRSFSVSDIETLCVVVKGNSLSEN